MKKFRIGASVVMGILLTMIAATALMAKDGKVLYLYPDSGDHAVKHVQIIPLDEVHGQDRDVASENLKTPEKEKGNAKNWQDPTK